MPYGLHSGRCSECWEHAHDFANAVRSCLSAEHEGESGLDPATAQTCDTEAVVNEHDLVDSIRLRVETRADMPDTPTGPLRSPCGASPVTPLPERDEFRRNTSSQDLEVPSPKTTVTKGHPGCGHHGPNEACELFAQAVPAKRLYGIHGGLGLMVRNPEAVRKPVPSVGGYCFLGKHTLM